MELNVDVFHNFFPGNALVTAGNLDDYNTMTIGWGALGSIWGKDAVTIYVRDSRYTLEYLRKCDYFTIDFFEGEHKKDLAILGSKSGRDGDKVALTSLTPVACCMNRRWIYRPCQKKFRILLIKMAIYIICSLGKL